MSTTTEEAAPAKSNKKLIIIIVAAALVVVAALGVVLFMLLKPAGEPKADPAATPGAVVPLEDEMTLNLADGKFLKTQLALQLSEKATEDAGGEEAAATAVDGSKARDAAIQILSKYTYAQLLKPATRDEAQQKLSAEAKERYEGDVLQVYFTQFVMQ